MQKKTVTKIFLLLFSVLIYSCTPLKGTEEIIAGKRFAREKNYIMAVGQFSQAINECPEYWYAYLCRGFAYDALKKADLAIQDYSTALTRLEKEERYRAIPGKDTWVFIYLRRGKLYYNSGSFQSAIDDFTKALEIDPKCAEAYYARAVTKKKMKLLSEANQDFSKAFSMMSKLLRAFNDSTKIEVYHDRAMFYLNQNKIDLAMADINTALEIKPGNIELIQARGIIRAKAGDFENAIQDFDKAIETDPSYNAYIWRAGLILIARCDLKKMLDDYESVIRLQNVDKDFQQAVFNDMAWILATTSDKTVRNSKKAIEYAKKSIAIKPDCANLDTLAAAFAGDGQFEEAIKTVSQAIDLCRSEKPDVLPELEKHLAAFTLKKDINEDCSSLRKEVQQELKEWKF